MRFLAVLCGAFLLLFVPVFGQLPQTRLAAVFPTAGQPGTTFDLHLVAGDDLEEIASLHFNHPGLTAQPKTQGTPPQPVPNVFTVTVAADVPPGLYDVRAAGRFGVSNPRRLSVTARPHVQEAEANNLRDQAQAVSLNQSVSGRFNAAADVDCYRFDAKAGQRVVIDCLAERLDSPAEPNLSLLDSRGRRIASTWDDSRGDPVLVAEIPADGSYVVRMHDLTYRGGGDYVYRLDLQTGPHIAFVIPSAGQAGTKGKFALYGFGLPGSQRTEEQLGNIQLERLDVEIDVPAGDSPLPANVVVRSHETGIDSFSYRLATAEGSSNAVRIGIAASPVHEETEPNDAREQAQAITAPAEISGRFLAPGDVDWFSFPAKKGESWWIEVIGQRKGNGVDPVLWVDEVFTTPEGKTEVKRVATVDDIPANAAANLFDTFTDDPYHRLDVPRDATYRVAVYDRYRGAGADQAYRLSIQPVQPDFRVVAMPSRPFTQNNLNGNAPWSVGLRQGDTIGIPVYAVRKHGLNGPIEITADGLPPGVQCSGTTIGVGQTSSLIVLHADENAAAVIAPVKLTAVAHPGQEREVRRTVEVATLTVTGLGNEPAQSRLTDSLIVSVIPEPAPYEVRIGTVREAVCPSRQVLVPVQIVRRNGFDDSVTLTVTGLQPALNIEAPNITIEKGKSEGLLRVFVKNNAPGGPVALWLASQGQVNYSRNPEKTARLKAEQQEVAARLAAAQAEVQKATAAKTAAEQEQKDLEGKLTAARAAVESKKSQTEAEGEDAAKALAAAEMEAVKLEQAVAAAAKRKTDAEAAEKAGQAAVAQADQQKKAIDPRVQEAEKQSAPKKLAFTPPSAPLVIDVRPAPFKLTATVANGGNLKQGGTLEVKIKVERTNGYAGPVKLSLAHGPGIAGLSGEVELPADQSETTLTLAAAADATEGAVLHPVIRAATTTGTPLDVDAPITLNITK